MPMSSFWMVEGTQVISPAGLNSRGQMYWTRKTSISQGPLLWMNFDLASRWWKTTKQLDDILCEQKKHQGPGALQWLLHMFLTSSKILKLWRQAKIVAILKSRKDPFIPKSFRPISLLCHTYKLFERLLLNMSMFLNMRERLLFFLRLLLNTLPLSMNILFQSKPASDLENLAQVSSWICPNSLKTTMRKGW